MRMICISLCFLFCASAGCNKGSDSAVSGTVTLDDKALANAVVMFRPTGDTKGLGGSGKTDAGGKITVTKNQGGKEIRPGTYHGVINKRQRPDGSQPGSN